MPRRMTRQSLSHDWSRLDSTREGYRPRAPFTCSAPVFLIGADPLRVGSVSRLGEPDRMRRPQGGLDMVAGSGTMER